MPVPFRSRFDADFSAPVTSKSAAGAGDQRLLAADLRHVLTHRPVEMKLVYQPQVCAATSTVVGVEALARWEHPERGLLNPEVFVDLAEQVGLSAALTRRVLDVALRDAAVLRRDGFAGTVSVNVPPSVAASAALREMVSLGLSRFGVEPVQLVVEVTETSPLDMSAATPVLRSLANAGVGVSLDDFGSGYANLSGVAELPLSELKLDRSFAEGLVQPDAARHRVLTRSMVSLAHTMGLTVVAEGIETPAHAAEAIKLGVDVLQGYSVSRPLPVAALRRWLADLPHSGS